jgi:hypothetical protein
LDHDRPQDATALQPGLNDDDAVRPRSPRAEPDKAAIARVKAQIAKVEAVKAWPC